MGMFDMISVKSVCFRIFLAMIIGGIIGLERETKRRPAGFRTYMFVCIGATLAIMIGQYEAEKLAENYVTLNAKADVLRIGAQVINGIGFLATGTIIVTGQQQIKGMTTAAGLWAAACLGLAVGAGFYECVVLGILLIFICIRLLNGLESRWVASSINMNVKITLSDWNKIAEITNWIGQSKIIIYDVELLGQTAEIGMNRIGVVFFLKLPQNISHALVIAGISLLDGIERIEEI